MTSDPTGIHSDWGKVLAVAQQEQCSVVSERKRREGGREGYVDMHGEGGVILYLLFLPPYKPRSGAVSQQARNKRGAYFSIWGTKGIGHGGEKIQPLKERRKKNASPSGAQIAF